MGRSLCGPLSRDISRLEQVGQNGALVLSVLSLLVILSRAWIFGNPLIDNDEQLYLLVGQRMLDGALPYRDLFDVKPFGLVLIYCLAAWISPGSAIGYQALAAVSVLATAWTIYRTASLVTTAGAALVGAALYIVWLPVFIGIGGQSPVFYNLPVAIAAWFCFGALKGQPVRDPLWPGCAIMALFGLALQIKYTVVFEGIAFGLTMLWASWQASRSSFVILRNGLVWVTIALLPSIASGAYFFANDAFAPYWQANMVSVLSRDGSFGHTGSAFARLAQQLLALGLFWWTAYLGLRPVRLADRPTAFLALWLLFALAGYLLFGTWYDHYVLPLLVPLSLCAALAIRRFARPDMFALRFVCVGLIAGIGRSVTMWGTEGSAQDLDRAVAIVRHYLGEGCLYVAGGPPALYTATRSCLATPYVFPSHLLSAKYTGTLADDPTAAMKDLLAKKPSVIVKGKPYGNPNVTNETMLVAALKSHYEFKTLVRFGVRHVEIWVRKSP